MCGMQGYKPFPACYRRSGYGHFMQNFQQDTICTSVLIIEIRLKGFAPGIELLDISTIGEYFRCHVPVIQDNFKRPPAEIWDFFFPFCLLQFGFDFTTQEIAILAVGMVVAFLVSVAVIKFLMGYIKKHDFTVFGWYRIALGILVLLLPVIGK